MVPRAASGGAAYAQRKPPQAIMRASSCTDCCSPGTALTRDSASSGGLAALTVVVCRIATAPAAKRSSRPLEPGETSVGPDREDRLARQEARSHVRIVVAAMRKVRGVFTLKNVERAPAKIGGRLLAATLTARHTAHISYLYTSCSSQVGS